MVEAAFIALRGSFRKYQPYEELADKTFGTPAERIGLNSNFGTEDNAARVEGLLAYFRNYRPALDILRLQLLNEVAGEAGGLPRLPLKKLHKQSKLWGWVLPGMSSKVVLTTEDAGLFSVSSDAAAREYEIELQVAYEAEFVAIEQLTAREAAELRGVKVSFKIYKGAAALGGWWPIRMHKASKSALYLHQEAMAALRLYGTAPEQPVQEEPKTSRNDRAEWDSKRVLAEDRLLQSLADGRYYTRSYSSIQKWDTVSKGVQSLPVNKLEIKVPEKEGPWRRMVFALGFLPFAGDRCHTWVRVDQNGLAVATRPSAEPREPPPATEDFLAMPTPL